ncbi:quinol:cytochrome C oxidoreductase [Flavobacteriaceae bacterium]|nr:quinol:cytochrome C oxidoreductase [Flavobacteriaceae bacterium]
MYQFSNKLKTWALALMVIGAIGVVYGFLTSPSDVEEVKEMMHAADASHGEHGEAKVVGHGDDHVTASENHGDADAHAEHVLHQLQNRPWSAFYVALFFFFAVTLGVLAFLAMQRVAQAGWSIVLFRVMEGITGNLLPVTIILFIFLMMSAGHLNHLFVWMNPENFDPASPNYDPIVDGKSMWLNIPGWIIRAVIYIAGWNFYRYMTRKLSMAQDVADNLVSYKKNWNFSVGFLLFFMLTESMMSWDWIMSLDPHWFSTLFGWYILASFLVSALTVIALVTLYLKSKGYLEIVNNSHIHDLAKFMFGLSVFWTYLWFSQFMLIWYADMPEETTYFAQRFAEYKLPFLAMIVTNFIFPVLLLMNSDYKRVPWFVVTAGIVILAGHYMDFFIMIMPATVGGSWSFGIPEIGGILFFTGLFIYSVFTSLTKAPLVLKNNPFLKESEEYHY